MTKFRTQRTKKAHVFRGAAVLITAVLMAALVFTGCRHKPTVSKYKVTFSVEGENGKLKAMDGTTEISSGVAVEQGKTVTFTATPNDGYKVKAWEVDGVVLTDNKTDSYTHTVTKEVKVKVIFESKTVIESYSVNFRVEYGNGGIEARVEGNTNTIESGSKVEKGKTITFTANANGVYTIKEWRLNGTPVNGTENPYSLKIDKDVIVTVEFKSTTPTPPPSPYKKVPYSGLADYLQNLPDDPEKTNHIEITGNIPIADFKESNDWKTSALGLKLKAQPTKKVALKIGTYPDGLTDMSGCFKSCTNLVSLANLPSGVANMKECFYGCEKLTAAPSVIPEGIEDMQCCFENCKKLKTAPAIPQSVKVMALCFYDYEQLTGVVLKCDYNASYIEELMIDAFVDAFHDCTALEDGGIKVPSTQLTIYKNNANDMGTTAAKFAASAP